MNIEHISDCTNHFGFGVIDNSIISKSFSWKEDEDIEFSSVIKYIELSDKNNIYLITSRICQYPITTLDKYLGLWNRLKKDYNLQIYRMNEKKIELNSFYVYFGVAEISKEQIELALRLLQMDFMHSYIILSNKTLELEQNFENILNISDNSSDYFLDYANIINSECYDNELIVFITGSDGSSINFFRLGINVIGENAKNRASEM